ncbi:MAG: calcium/sodium antiporter [Alphaproteobacteria bacterium]|nr:MAG: calcium/sodium antiporter [Alphaproteobacteria bacterium]
MDYAIAALGLAMLVGGGELLVRGSIALALRLNVTPWVIGLTVVAFGTSAPELVVSLDAALIKDTPQLALGNVVGSNIANVLLVLGVPALIVGMSCTASALSRDTLIMVGGTILFIVLCMFGALGFWSGVILFAVLIVHMTHAARSARANPEMVDEEMEELDADTLAKLTLAKSLTLVAIGFVGLCIGAHLLVVGAIDVARSLGISEAAIGLTMVAIGTSLPELSTSIVAALRKHCDVAIGNVIGSNLFNLLGIMGITSMITVIPVPESFLTIDLWVMLGTALMLIPIGVFNAPINRMTGIIFLTAYASYIAWVL